MPLVVVYVEGLIGAGKSTLLRNIERVSDPKRVRVIYEPVDEWEKFGMLSTFYNDPARWAYTFQTYVCISRIQAITVFLEKLSVEEEYNSLEFLFVERSVFSDRYFFMKNLYESGKVNEVEMKVYESWWEMWKKLLPEEFHKKNMFLYVKPSMETVMRRVETRARSGENLVSNTYQEQLQCVHDEFFSDGNSVNTAAIPTLVGVKVVKGVTPTGNAFVTITSDGELNEDTAKIVVNNVFQEKK